MKIAVFSAKSYDKEYLTRANQQGHELTFFEARLSVETAPLIKGHAACCVFVHDRVTRDALEIFAKENCTLLALRCAGFNNVDIEAAQEFGIHVVRVPAYSPHGVAEFAVSLIMGLNRKVHRAHHRVRELNFSLEGLTGFDLFGKTVGVIGTGKIGFCFAQIMLGFGCKVICYDLHPNKEVEAIGAKYVPLESLFAESDIISLHCPLTPSSRYFINQSTLNRMKNGVMLINTSRGELIKTQDVIQSLKDGKVGYLGIDVYEEEEGIFFEDMSSSIVKDDVLSRLLTFPNVLITSHQAFFTDEALMNIAKTTMDNITEFDENGSCENEVSSTVN